MAEVGVLNLQIRDNSATAASGLNKLASALERVRDAVGGIKSLGRISTQIEGISNAIRNVSTSGTIENLNGLASALKRVREAADGIDLSKIKFSVGTGKSGKTDIGAEIKRSAIDAAGAFATVGSRIEEDNDGLERMNALVRNVGWTAGETEKQFERMFSAWNKMRMGVSLGGSSAAGFLGGGAGEETGWKQYNPWGETSETGWAEWKNGAIDAEYSISDAAENIGNRLKETSGFFLAAGESAETFAAVASDVAETIETISETGGGNLSSAFIDVESHIEEMNASLEEHRRIRREILEAQDRERLERNYPQYRELYMYGGDNWRSQIPEMYGFSGDVIERAETYAEAVKMAAENAERIQAAINSVVESYASMARLAGGSSPLLLGSGGVPHENALSTWVDTSEQWKPDWTGGENFKPDWIFGEGTVTESVAAANTIQEATETIKESAEAVSPSVESMGQSIAGSGEKSVACVNKLKNLDRELKEKKKDADGAKSAFDRFKEGMSNLLAPARNLINSFARMAKYRMMRAIIREIASGFKEGLQNLYFYSKAVGTDFAPAMDSAASSLLQMKNAIGAAVAPAIQALIPVLQTVVSWFITAVNYANQFMALISGKSGWTRALPVAADAFTETGRSARGAGRAARDAAKDVKELLADWDELNIIQSETGDNGGSGGGGGRAGATATDYASMFEEVSGFNDEVRAFTENLRNQFGGVLGFVEKIGAAVLGWRVSQAFAGVIGALGGFVSTGAIIDLVFNIAQVFDKTYMQTGNAGWLVADVLTTLLGGTLAQRILRRVIGGGVANLVLPITFAVSAIASIKALVGQTDVSALSRESILTAITAALKGGAAAGLLLHAGGIPILQSIGAGVAGSLITFGAAIGIKAIKTVVDTGVITKETILADVTSALATGLGVAGLELALGGTVAAAETLGAGALVFTMAALIGIQAILSKPKRVTWGDYSATQEEIQAYVENTLFTVKPNTQIALLNPKIEAVSTSESGLIATADEIKLAAKKVVIGFNDKETLADLEKQIFGDSENGTTGLIGQFNETIRNKHAVIETGIMLTLGSTKEGGQEAKSLIASDSKEWKVLEGHMADLGKQLSASLKKAYDESLDEDTRQMAISSIEQLTSMMEEVSYAISQGEAAARAEINLSKNLGSLSKDSISGIVDYIAQYREEMTSATAEAWDAVTVQKGGLVAGLRQSMENALELAGGDTDNATYKAYKAAYDKATDEYNAWVAGRDDAIKDAADKAKNSKAWEKLRESILGMIDGKAGVESLTDGVYESLSSMLSGGDATKDEVLGYMIDAYFGKDAETIRALVREGVLEYKDVISEEAIEALGSTAGIYGSPEMIDAWNKFVTELFGGGIGTIEPEPLDVEQELEVQTEVKEATGGGNGDETVLGTLKETTEKHLAETDVVISTHTFPATSAVDTSATTSATEQMKNDIRNDVLEAIAYLDLINRYTGHIADGRTHLTETSRFVRTRATGGTIRSGEMFFANENGNIEMMGKMGNSAVVANNQQIVDGISKGVAASNKGMENSMDMMVSLMRQFLSKELTARVVPSSSMGRNNAMSNEAYRRVTG